MSENALWDRKYGIDSKKKFAYDFCLKKKLKRQCSIVKSSKGINGIYEYIVILSLLQIYPSYISDSHFQDFDVFLGHMVVFLVSKGRVKNFKT